MHPTVTAVQVIPPYRLRLTFQDGTTGVVDCRPWLERRGDGVFAELRDQTAFASVYVNHELGVIEWPNGADICPDTLYEEAHSLDGGTFHSEPSAAP
jgi:hypothetical protein